MGVLGLWQLLAPVGQPVTLESLENKIFAVDISIWLNQAVKGYRDGQGGSVPNAHLLSLFSRLCKLLFYKIRPIIVFDGGFPELKKQTIINRQQRRAAVKQNSREVGLKILSNYLASQNLAASSGETSSKKTIKPKEKARDELFMLPPLPDSSLDGGYETSDATDTIEWKFTNFNKEDIKYLNQIDIESDDFNDLPPDVKQEILSTLKESRKHRTYEQYNELPEDSNEFSTYQMQCLLKKRSLSRKLEQVQKDIRQINTADFIAHYTNDHVIGETNKIMSDDCSHYVLLKKIIPKSDSASSDKIDDDNSSPSCSMIDTKNAFIKDLENIDIPQDSVDEYFDSKDNRRTDNPESNMDHYDDLHEEEVDNPPQSCKSSSKNISISPKSDGKYLQGEKQKVKSKSISSDVILSDEDCDESESDNEIGVKEIEIDHKNSIIEISSNEVAKEERKLPATAPIKIQNLSEEYLEPISKAEENVVLSSSDDEMIPCDEIDADSLIPQTHTKNEYASEIPLSDWKKPSGDSVNETIDLDSSIERPASESTSFVKVSDKLTSTNIVESLPSTSFNKILSDKERAELAEKNLQLQRDLESATAILEADQAKQDRQANTVQEHMIEECKELLQLFGIPFVVSPTEAEAQCAFYDLANLSHGTITDDSDVWLFGGKRVYKNFFTQQKYVEFYKDNEIFNHFGLNREKLINFAMLTGSDYTEGIEGVGPVTAMEIISEFPGEGLDALAKFKDWWSRAIKQAIPPENKTRAKLLKLVLSESFPDDNIAEAYLRPEIDESTEKFTWGRPDLDTLRDYTRERFGWPKSKVDEALLPVIKKLSERDTQTHLDSFFTINLKKKTELFPSKRIMSALKKITTPEKRDAKEDVQTKGTKRKSKSGTKKTVPKKVVKKANSNTKNCSVKKVALRAPVLSEESSDDDG